MRVAALVAWPDPGFGDDDPQLKALCRSCPRALAVRERGSAGSEG
jgi:hypothetical protein